MIQCERCKGQTKEKRITSKKNGKEYTIYECTSGCMNGKFPFSCFAQKLSKPPFIQRPSSTASTPSPVVPSKPPVDTLLQNKIDSLIQKVDLILQELKGYVPEGA